MRLIYKIILTVFVCIASYGQSTDSLLTVLEELEGGSRIEVLHFLLADVVDLRHRDFANLFNVGDARSFGDSRGRPWN